jgi:subtilisin family serine protease
MSMLVATTNYAAGPIRVAVIDTGLAASAKVKICKTGHKDLVDPTGNMPVEPHGTNVSGLIEQYAGDANYCQIIIRWYMSGMDAGMLKTNLALGVKAAIDAKADIINISGGGKEPYELEHKYIKLALDKGIKVIVAAGNDGNNLDYNCNYFPACYDKRIVVIGNVNQNGVRHYLSNYGKIVNHYVVGVDRCAQGICMTGTSQSTAIVTGRIVREMHAANKKKNNRSITGH